jgi:hypothetical protein
VETSKLSVQERFNRYYEAKMLLFTGQVASNPALVVDPAEIPITPKTGVEDLRERQAAFRDKMLAQSIMPVDIGI